MELEQILAALDAQGSYATGSRVIVGEATEASDYDVVVLVEKIDEEFQAKVLGLGFDLCHDQYTDDDHFIVRRASDNLNLIITQSEQKYDLWVKCTNVSIVLRLDKAQRKVLFSAMIDDEA